MNKEELFFKNLQPGDSIYVYLDAHSPYTEMKVERLTRTQIVCVGGRRFRRGSAMAGEIGGENKWATSPHIAAQSWFHVLARQASCLMTLDQLNVRIGDLQALIAEQERQWP